MDFSQGQGVNNRKLRLAIIGTNWITERFVNGALESQQFELVSAYSRDVKRAEQFVQPFNPQALVFSDLTQMAQCEHIDAVYVASPNSLHFAQSRLMMEHGKHVICEKPMSSNYAQAVELFNIAQTHDVVFFEAFKGDYLPNFALLREQLPKLGKIHKASINYCQYSSRYQKYLDGENPNTFNPEFSNGSIMDIGFYCVASTVALFGEPESVLASAHLLESGVDAHGSVIFKYPHHDVVMMHSKVSDSYIDSEIQGELGVIKIYHISEFKYIEIQLRGQEPEILKVPQSDNGMSYEAAYFANLIQTQQRCEKSKTRSLAVAKLLTEIRQQTGVKFPADKI